MQIAYQIARAQFPNRLRETFLVLSDDEPRPPPALEARRLSLEPRVQDPRVQESRPDRGAKHRREPDSMSVDSASIAKRADQSRSAEKSKAAEKGKAKI